MKKLCLFIISIMSISLMSFSNLSYSEDENEKVKQAIQTSTLLKDDGFEEEIKASIDNAEAYPICFISAVDLPNVKSLNDATKAPHEWHVFFDTKDITVSNENGNWKVTGYSIPTEATKPSYLTLHNVESYTSQNSNYCIISVPEYHARFVLSENEKGLFLSMIQGREDFTGLELGKILPLNDVLNTLQKNMPLEVMKDNTIGGTSGNLSLESSVQNDKEEKDYSSWIYIAGTSFIIIGTIVSTVLVIVKKKRE